MIPRGEIGAMVDAFRRAEHPLPEVMETEEMEAAPEKKRGGIVAALRRLIRLRDRPQRRSGRR